MYFKTNYKDVNIWSDDLLELVKDCEGCSVYETARWSNDLTKLSDEYVDFMQGNMIRSDRLKVGDEIFLMNQGAFKVLNYEFHRYDKYYIHLLENKESKEKLSYILNNCYVRKLN